MSGCHVRSTVLLRQAPAANITSRTGPSGAGARGLGIGSSLGGRGSWVEACEAVAAWVVVEAWVWRLVGTGSGVRIVVDVWVETWRGGFVVESLESAAWATVDTTEALEVAMAVSDWRNLANSSPPSQSEATVTTGATDRSFSSPLSLSRSIRC